MGQSSQKYISRNRAPRVQIEYDVELYGAQKKINIPFIMGVLADLTGVPKGDVQPVEDRKFLEIDAENFDERLKAAEPHVTFRVDNKLTGDGELSVDLGFERLDDFSPVAVARKVDGLKELLEARTQLDRLLTFMDGKSGAEDLIADLIKNPALLETVTASAPPDDDKGDAQASESTATQE